MQKAAGHLRISFGVAAGWTAQIVVHCDPEVTVLDTHGGKSTRRRDCHFDETRCYP